MSLLPYTISRNAATVFINGTPNSVDDTHPNYAKVIELLQSGDYTIDAMQELVSVKAFIETAVAEFGRVKVGIDAIFYDGVAIHSHLTDRMLELLKQGFDIKPWATFMEKLYLNPSKTAVDELFLWLEQSGMPITPDGCFLAYKKVNDDFSSFHNNADGSKFWNYIGATVEMPRNQVNDNRNVTCSDGLHFCSWQYLPHYYGSRGKVLVLKINPADVVSIPSDYNNAKGRAARYEIVSEIEPDKAQFAFDNLPIVDIDSWAA